MSYSLSPNADRTGTCLRGYVTASYAQLRDLFGEPPAPVDVAGKVSTEWTFVDDLDKVYTVYDYKETALYDSSLPSVAAFRALPHYDWHIGAVTLVDAHAFTRWLWRMLHGKEPA